jgi:protein-tyrosine kinase
MGRMADAMKRAGGGWAAERERGDETVAEVQVMPGVTSQTAPWGLRAEHPADVEAHEAAMLRPRPPATTPSPHVGFPARRTPSPDAERLLTSPTLAPGVRDQYSKLAARLHRTQLERTLQTVMVTSALPGEGKTLTTANLGLSLSEAYERTVLLIDADLRNPSLHSLFGFERGPGLSEALASGGEPTFVRLTGGLSLMVAGTSQRDPLGALTSDAMRRLIGLVRTRFDWVLIDTPPVGLLPDANILASATDGAIVVTSAGMTPYDAALRACESLGRQHLLGVVLNRAEDTALAETYANQSYYGRYSPHTSHRA